MSQPNAADDGAARGPASEGPDNSAPDNSAPDNSAPDSSGPGNGGPGNSWSPTGDGPLDPREAALLLDQVTQQAHRTFTPGTPLLWTFRAFLALVAFGSFWLSVRDQHPYTGTPSGWALAITFALVAINIGWSAAALRRAGSGVSGPAERRRRAWLGGMLVVWIVAFAVTTPLYHGGASHPVWGLYPASAPLMIIGIVGALTAPARRDWPIAGVCLALAIVGAVAGFGGPVGAWLIMGIGLSAAMLATAAYTAWRQRISVVRA